MADPPWEWDAAYFDLLAHCLPGLASPEVELLALAPICSLPDEAFFDVVTSFLRSVDAVYFGDGGLQETIAVRIRSALADRLVASNDWKRLAGSRSASIWGHVGPAIAVLFFNDYGFTQPASCYLSPKGVDRLDPFLPVLGELVKSGPSHFAAVVTLNLLEVSRRSAHLPFLVAAAKTWLGSYANDSDFWVDYGMGRRTCVLIEEARLQEPARLDTDDAMRSDVDRLLAGLINLGVPEARRLEEALARGSGSGA